MGANDANVGDTPVSPILIRAAGPADAARLARLCADHAAFEQIPYDPAGHAERLTDALAAQPPRLHAWLVVRDDELLGYATATLDFSTLDGRPFLHMDCLYVDELARNHGLGARLMQSVLVCARQLGCTNLQWQTPDWNQDAIRFYRRSGARELTKARFTLSVSESC